MGLPKELERQTEIVHWINAHLSRQFFVDQKHQLALACFDLALEHHVAICTLCDSELYGAMYALVRVEFEAVGNGLWLRHVATEEQIKKYIKDDTNIGFGTLLAIIESRVGSNAPVLTNLKKRYWNILSSFTHSGFQAVARRVNDTHTGGVNYSKEEIITNLRLSGILALLAAAELSSMADDSELVEITLEKFKQYLS